MKRAVEQGFIFATSRAGAPTAVRQPFTDSLPAAARRSPRIYQVSGDDRAMSDFLVIAGIVLFVAAMLGLIWGLERV